MRRTGGFARSEDVLKEKLQAHYTKRGFHRMDPSTGQSPLAITRLNCGSICQLQMSQHPSFQKWNVFHLRGQASAKGFTDEAHQKIAEIQKKLGKAPQVSRTVEAKASTEPKARAKRAAKRVKKPST